MNEKRLLGRATGLRLFLDQEEWLNEMEQKRSAGGHAIIRAAVDFYRPIYEATHQNLDPAVIAKVFEANRVLGPEGLVALLDTATDGPGEMPAEVKSKLLSGQVVTG